MKALNRAEVAALLHMHPRSLDKLRRTDASFPAPFRPGGPRGFPRWLASEVEGWFAAHRDQPKRAA